MANKRLQITYLQSNNVPTCCSSQKLFKSNSFRSVDSSGCFLYSQLSQNGPLCGRVYYRVRLTNPEQITARQLLVILLIVGGANMRKRKN